MNEFEENMTAYVRYRLEKAEETYQAAVILYNASQWNSVINRLYYACFYTASALLLYRHIPANWAVLRASGSFWRCFYC